MLCYIIVESRIDASLRSCCGVGRSWEATERRTTFIRRLQAATGASEKNLTPLLELYNRDKHHSAERLDRKARRQIISGGFRRAWESA